ncbi:hypothetical protein [Comamonas sp.]|uniref:hypothetical protein n=1 Tax=Comamonas sp. TaxID=34028 RepID=UPI0028A73DF2|nr:hypothetical protein [Comamonas sp.]
MNAPMEAKDLPPPPPPQRTGSPFDILKEIAERRARAAPPATTPSKEKEKR